MKIFVYFIGHPRDPHANALAQDYITRASRYARTEMTEIQPQRANLWAKHPTARKVFLEPSGAPVDSAGFAAMVSRAELEARDLVFVIGGHDGLPAGWAARADALVSLSPLTMPHELARVVLAEQIYRAFATLRGHPYPR